MNIHRATESWKGHLPVTSVALLSILERIASGETLLSRAERGFYVACEIWAAVNARDLDALYASVGTGPLRDAHAAFSAIGAEHVADILRNDVFAPVAASADTDHRRRMDAFEERLRRVPEPVDELIARYARCHLGVAPRHSALAPAVARQASL